MFTYIGAHGHAQTAGPAGTVASASAAAAASAAISSSNVLKTSAARRIREDIRAAFPHVTAEEDWARLFPLTQRGGATSLGSDKWNTPKCEVFWVDKHRPLFIQVPEGVPTSKAQKREEREREEAAAAAAAAAASGISTTRPSSSKMVWLPGASQPVTETQAMFLARSNPRLREQLQQQQRELQRQQELQQQRKQNANGAAASAVPTSTKTLPAGWYPTIYALWLVPHLLPSWHIAPSVSRYLLNGADLMLPGVTVPANGPHAYGTWRAGDVRAIVVDGNPAPIGFGVLLVDSDHVATAGWTGRGMTIAHMYGDTLWASGDRSIPNVGFLSNRVSAIVASPSSAGIAASGIAASGIAASGIAASGTDDANDAQVPGVVVGEPEGEPEGEAEGEPGEVSAVGAAADVQVDAAAAKRDEEEDKEPEVAAERAQVPDQPAGPAAHNVDEADGGAHSDAHAEDSPDVPSPLPSSSSSSSPPSSSSSPTAAQARATPAAPTVSREEMDAAMLQALCYAIKFKVQDSDLPLTPSQLMSAFMEPMNACPFRLDAKVSSYKKVGKFLKDEAKSGLFRVKASKTDVVVTAVDRSHAMVSKLAMSKEFVDAVKYKVKLLARIAAQNKAAAGAAADADADADDAADGSDGDPFLKPERHKLTILIMYKPDSQLQRTVFARPAASAVLQTPLEPGDAPPPWRRQQLFTLQEARQVVLAYVQEEGLDGGASVRLDETLAELFATDTERAMAGGATSVPGATASRGANRRDEDDEEEEEDERVPYDPEYAVSPDDDDVAARRATTTMATTTKAARGAPSSASARSSSSSSSSSSSPPSSSPSPIVLLKSVLAQRLNARLRMYHAIVLDGAPGLARFHAGTVTPVDVVTGVRSGKKFSRVFGLERFGIDPVEFARDAAHAWACSATTATGMSYRSAPQTTVHVFVQGNISAEVAARLEEWYGVPAQHVRIESM